MDDAYAWAQHQRDEAAGLNAARIDTSWDVATAPFRCSYLGKKEDGLTYGAQYYDERVYTAEDAANDVTKELVLRLGESINEDADAVESMLKGCGGDLKETAAKLKEAGATAGLLPQARPLLVLRRNPHAAGAAPCTGGARACCASSASAAKPVRRHVTTRTARREFYTLVETCGPDPDEIEWLEAQSKLEEEAEGEERPADDGGSGKSFLCESCHQTWQHAAAQEAHAAAQVEREVYDEAKENRAAEEAWRQQRAQEQKRKRAEKQEAAEKRLKAMAGPEQDAYQKLNKLKKPQLEQLCAANKCPKSGSKAILVNRLLGFHTHGRKSGCPRCAESMRRNASFRAKDNSKLELEFVDGQPVAIKCTHQKGVGAKCGYRAELTPATKATILDIPPRQLADPDGYLAGVGLQDTAGSAQAQESGAVAVAGLPAASAFGGGGTFAGRPPGPGFPAQLPAHCRA